MHVCEPLGPACNLSWVLIPKPGAGVRCAHGRPSTSSGKDSCSRLSFCKEVSLTYAVRVASSFEAHLHSMAHALRNNSSVGIAAKAKGHQVISNECNCQRRLPFPSQVLNSELLAVAA